MEAIKDLRRNTMKLFIAAVTLFLMCLASNETGTMNLKSDRGCVRVDCDDKSDNGSVFVTVLE